MTEYVFKIMEYTHVPQFIYFLIEKHLSCFQIFYLLNKKKNLNFNS